MAVGTASPARRRSRLPHAVVTGVRAWTRVLGTATGVAALAGATQLGLAYGLRLVDFSREFADRGVWSSHLTWTAWCALLAVLAGAASGSWMFRRSHAQPGASSTAELGQRIAIILAAAIGAGVTVGLAALPASQAHVTGSDSALEAALAATLGIVAGILASVAVLNLRVVALSVGAVAAVGWVLALVSVAPSLAPNAAPPLVRLGVLDLPWFSQLPAVAVLSPPVLALLVGGGVAVAATTRGLPALHIALAGGSGPAVLLVPYLIAAPGVEERAVQAPAFGGAVVGVAAGLLAAAIALLVRLLREREVSAPTVTDLPEQPARRLEELEEPDDSPPSQPPDTATKEAEAAPGPPVPAAAAEPPATTATVPPLFDLPAPPPAAPQAPSEVDQAPSEVDQAPARTEPSQTTETAQQPADTPAAPAAESVAETAPAADAEQPADPPAAPPKKRRRRRREDDHVDWVRSLSGGPEQTAPEPTEDERQGKRRLRLDDDLLAGTDPSAFDAPVLPSARQVGAPDEQPRKPRPSPRPGSGD